MTPILQLDSLYKICFPNRSLENDLGWYLACHYVFSTPDFIVMGKPVRKDAPEEQLDDVTFVFPKEEVDTWFLYAYAGSQQDFLAYVPFSLTWIAWRRYGSPIRYWTLEQFIKRCKARIPCRIVGLPR